MQNFSLTESQIEVIRKDPKSQDWYKLSKKNSSEDFIREFQDNVLWYNISLYQRLSEEFIREFQDKVYWRYISDKQILSESFIKEFESKIAWDIIFCSQKLSEQFIKDFQDKFIIENHMLFKRIGNQFGSGFKGQCLFAKDSINITNDFLKLAGYFVAEGCCSKNVVIFSFNKAEKEYHEEVIGLMKKTFGEITFRLVPHRVKNSLVIVFQSVIASRLFSFMFGRGARNKKLPTFMFSLTEEQKYCFLHGLFNGDGSYSKKYKTSLSTASVDLVNNVFDILFSIGIKSTIKSRTLPKGILNGSSFGGNIYYSLQISNLNHFN